MRDDEAKVSVEAVSAKQRNKTRCPQEGVAKVAVNLQCHENREYQNGYHMSKDFKNGATNQF